MTTWSTRDEINFLRGIGNWRGIGQHAGYLGRVDYNIPILQRKLLLLKKYQTTMSLRSKWEGIDKGKVEDFLREEITRVTKLIPTAS